MNDYSFDSVRILRRREGLDLEKDYRKIIRDRAADGWEFVQAISFENHADPRIELVFTRRD